MSKVIPAILTSRIEILEKRLKIIEGASDWVQIDIMDGIFVDSVSIKLEDLLNLLTRFKLELHLMVENPISYIDKAKKAGAERVIFHIESSGRPDEIIRKIKKLGMEVGIALNPETSPYKVDDYIKEIDEILLLSVTPGFAGQTIRYESLEKVKEIKEMKNNMKIGMDGGIDLENIDKIAKAGIDYIVSGTGIFETENPVLTIERMREKIK